MKIDNANNKNKMRINRYNKENNISKEKNRNYFSIENIFGMVRQNKTQLSKEKNNKEEIIKNRNSYSQKNIQKDNNNNENNEGEDKDSNVKNTIYNRRKKILIRLKYKQEKKEIYMKEETMKNEEDNDKTKEAIDEGSKWKRRNMIPKKLENKSSSVKHRNNNIININNEINKEDANSFEQINNKNFINNNINLETKKRKITILEDVLISPIDTTKPVVQ